MRAGRWRCISGSSGAATRAGSRSEPRVLLRDGPPGRGRAVRCRPWRCSSGVSKATTRVRWLSSSDLGRRRAASCSRAVVRGGVGNEPEASAGRPRRSAGRHDDARPRLLPIDSFEKAIPLYEEASRAREATLGRQHPKTLYDDRQPGRELTGRGTIRGSRSAPGRGLEERQAAPGAGLRRPAPARRLRRSGRPGGRGQHQEGHGPAPRVACREARDRYEGKSRAPAGVGLLRLEADPPPGLGRGGAAAPRVPGDPREGAARRVDDVQHQVDARRGAPRPEEVRRGRAAAPRGIPRHEGARGGHRARTWPRCGSPRRSNGS